jgi:hypothetical protein
MTTSMGEDLGLWVREGSVLEREAGKQRSKEEVARGGERKDFTTEDTEGTQRAWRSEEGDCSIGLRSGSVVARIPPLRGPARTNRAKPGDLDRDDSVACRGELD